MYLGSLTSLINRMVLVAHIFGFTNFTNKFYNIPDPRPPSLWHSKEKENKLTFSNLSHGLVHLERRKQGTLRYGAKHNSLVKISRLTNMSQYDVKCSTPTRSLRQRSISHYDVNHSRLYSNTYIHTYIHVHTNTHTHTVCVCLHFYIIGYANYTCRCYVILS